MDPYAVNLMLGASVAAHIVLLHTIIEAHAQDPFSDFHSITIRAHRLLWSLPIVHQWMEFGLRYHHYMVTRNLGWDGSRFQAHGAFGLLSLQSYY